jgi:hypothetical protein
MPTGTYTLGAVGVSPPMHIGKDMLTVQFLPPAVMCLPSNGAVLTYSVEVTGDNLKSPTYNPATGNWFPMDGMSGLTAGANASLGAQITGIRLHVTAWTSGTVTAVFVFNSSEGPL